MTVGVQTSDSLSSLWVKGSITTCSLVIRLYIIWTCIRRLSSFSFWLYLLHTGWNTALGFYSMWWTNVVMVLRCLEREKRGHPDSRLSIFWYMVQYFECLTWRHPNVMWNAFWLPSSCSNLLCYWQEPNGLVNYIQEPTTFSKKSDQTLFSPVCSHSISGSELSWCRTDIF